MAILSNLIRSLSDFEVSCGNRDDRRTYFDGSKIVYDQHDYFFNRGNRFISYCNAPDIVSNRASKS